MFLYQCRLNFIQQLSFMFKCFVSASSHPWHISLKLRQRKLEVCHLLQFVRGIMKSLCNSLNQYFMTRNKQIKTKDKSGVFSHISVSNIFDSLSWTFWTLRPLQHRCMVGYIFGANTPTSSARQRKSVFLQRLEHRLLFTLLWPLSFHSFTLHPCVKNKTKNLCQLCWFVSRRLRLRRQTFGDLNCSQASAVLSQKCFWFHFTKSSWYFSVWHFIHIIAGSFNPLSRLLPKILHKRRSQKFFLLWTILKRKGEKKEDCFSQQIQQPWAQGVPLEPSKVTS